MKRRLALEGELKAREEKTVAEIVQTLLEEYRALDAHTHGMAYPDCPKCKRLRQIKELLQLKKEAERRGIWHETAAQKIYGPET